MIPPDPKSIPIRPASTAIILRDGAKGMEVFMVVRHSKMAFASGAFVFPGGKVELHDGEFENPEAAQSSHHRSAQTSSGEGVPGLPFWMAAIRETFEEAGLALMRKRGDQNLLGAEEAHRLVEDYRPAILDGNLAFGDLLRKNDLIPATDLMVHFAHWITPPGRPRRFDTHFFLIAAPVEQFGVHDGSEVVEGVWTTPAKALADTDAGKRIMVPATRLNVTKLAQDGRVEDVVERARASQVVTVSPRVEQVEGGRKLHLPIEAGYGMSELFVPSEG